jgi:hypothetical protein
MLAGPPAQVRAQKKTVIRHATVRYYNRMNPEQVYPLLVAITKNAIQAITKEPLDQRSRSFKVTVSAVVEIEPILPGCDCYPPKQSVRISEGDQKATFHVVPKVRGAVLGARVEVRCQGSVLTTVPLELRVVSKAPATVLCVSTLALPFAVAVLKLFNIDFEATLQVLVGAVFLAATGTTYVLARPRKRDAFWDLTPVAIPRMQRLRDPTTQVASPARTITARCPSCNVTLEVDVCDGSWGGQAGEMMLCCTWCGVHFGLQRPPPEHPPEAAPARQLRQGELFG